MPQLWSPQTYPEDDQHHRVHLRDIESPLYPAGRMLPALNQPDCNGLKRGHFWGSIQHRRWSMYPEVLGFGVRTRS